MYCYHGLAKLAEPKNHEENNAISNLSTKLMFIGVNDIKHEGRFIYESTGKEITYSNFQSLQPDNCCSTGEDGVEVNWVCDFQPQNTFALVTIMSLLLESTRSVE